MAAAMHPVNEARILQPVGVLDSEVIPFPSRLNEFETGGEVEWVRQTSFVDLKTGEERLRKTGFIEIGDHHHLIRMSEPVPSLVQDKERSEILTYGVLTGWTECIDAGSGKRLQDTVVDANPEAYVIAIATDGVSVHGHPLSYREAINRSFYKMAEDRLQIFNSLAGPGARLSLVGRSMGAILSLLIAHKNLETKRMEDQLGVDLGAFNIEELVYINPGIVAAKVPEAESFRKSLDTTAGRVLTFANFVGHISVDSVREGVQHPKEALLAALGFSAFTRAIVKEPDKLTAMVGNFLEIMEGTPWEIIKDVFANHKTLVRTGTRDTVREEAMYQTLKELFPDKVDLIIYPRKGHAMSLSAEDIVSSIAA